MDFERKVSSDVSSSFAYFHESAIHGLINSGTCNQTVEQLCQPWVQRLYDIDVKNRSSLNDGDSLHACQCLSYQIQLNNGLGASHDR